MTIIKEDIYEIGPEIKALNRQLHRFIQNAPHIAEMDRVAGTYGWIIGFVAKHAGEVIYQKDVEKEFGLSRSGASRAIGFLEEKGLIRRESVPEDARLKKLVLTEKGQEMELGIHSDFAWMNRALINGFSEEELEQLTSYLKRLQRNMKEAENGGLEVE